MPRRTKIVCTIGPASSPPAILRQLVTTGMDVARLNFSHGSHEDHRATYNDLREIEGELGANVAILMDLQGPKIRTGSLRDGGFIELVEGEEFTLTTEACAGDVRRVSTTYAQLAQDVAVGDRILLADGTLELHVDAVHGNDVTCEVIRGGKLGEHKGINLPGVKLAEPSLTDKDREDLDFGLALGVDFVALSFVRHPDDIRGLRSRMDAAHSTAGIVAKIERPEALEHFDEILALSDAIMIARGDLGVELAFERVPILQKRLIAQCNAAGKPVITATQMLESMVSYARPTRAETADVANAIYDGTDAVMLSGETAAGVYPVESCRVMARIAMAADDALLENPAPEHFIRQRTAADAPAKEPHQNLFADAIGQAVCRMSAALDIARIVCFTTTGYTARAIGRYRPGTGIIAFTNTEAARRRCALYWGVSAIRCEDFDEIDALTGRVEELLIEYRFAELGQTIIVVAGTPLVVGGRTNLLKLHVMGDPVA